MNRYLVACLLAGGAAAAPLAASAHVDVVVGLPVPAIGIQFAPPVPVFAAPPVAYPAYGPGPVAVAPYPDAYTGYYPAWRRAYWGPQGYYGHGYYGHGYYGHGWVGHGHR